MPQDLEILKGYVPGYDQVLGHEFVGRVERCPSEPSLVGQRVVGEINCRCHGAQPHADPVFERNHSPGRTVLGIIGKDVCLQPQFLKPFRACMGLRALHVAHTYRAGWTASHKA